MRAPISDWVANHFGARWSLGIAAISAVLAALVAVLTMRNVWPRRRTPGYILDAFSWQKLKISTSLNWYNALLRGGMARPRNFLIGS
jgi:hypothetical protein